MKTDIDKIRRALLARLINGEISPEQFETHYDEEVNIIFNREINRAAKMFYNTENSRAEFLKIRYRSELFPHFRWEFMKAFKEADSNVIYNIDSLEKWLKEFRDHFDEMVIQKYDNLSTIEIFCEHFAKDCEPNIKSKFLEACTALKLHPKDVPTPRHAHRNYHIKDNLFYDIDTAAEAQENDIRNSVHKNEQALGINPDPITEGYEEQIDRSVRFIALNELTIEKIIDGIINYYQATM